MVEIVRNGKVNKIRLVFLLFGLVVPIAHFLLFYVYTNFSSILMAFQNAQGNWSFDNFVRFWKELTDANSDIWIALKNTFITFGLILITYPFKVLVSYFIYKKIPLAGFYRVVFFIPTIVFSVAVSLVFVRMMGTNGVIAKTIGDIAGLNYVPELLADSRFANYTIWFNMLWLTFPGNLIIWGGTFARIPIDVLESARLDGVTWWTEFTKIIVPMVWPTVALQMVLMVCSIFGSSGQVWLLTKGQYGTHTLSSWMYEVLVTNSGTLYTSNVYNYLSAVGLIITVIAVLLSVIVRKWTDKAFTEVEF